MSLADMQKKTEQNSLVCKICDKPCVSGIIQCDRCERWIHYACSNLPAYQLLLFEATDEKFVCNICAIFVINSTNHNFQVGKSIEYIDQELADQKKGNMNHSSMYSTYLGTTLQSEEFNPETTILVSETNPGIVIQKNSSDKCQKIYNDPNVESSVQVGIKTKSEEHDFDDENEDNPDEFSLNDSEDSMINLKVDPNYDEECDGVNYKLYQMMLDNAANIDMEKSPLINEASVTDHIYGKKILVKPCPRVSKSMKDTDASQFPKCKGSPRKRKRIIKRSMRKEQKRKMLSCDHCSFTTPLPSYLQRHALIHEAKRLACGKCRYKTNCKSYLKRHAKVHTNPQRVLACCHCSFKTADKVAFQRHANVHRDEKPYACRVCQYRTKNRHSLKDHMMIHNGTQPFACKLCDFRAVRSNGLKNHMLTHTGEKPYLCEFCSYQTTRISTYKNHVLTHTKEKPHPCDICVFRGRTRSALQRHLLIHGSEKRFSCEQCNYRTNRNCLLKSHLLIHTNERPFSCTLCSYRARLKTSLKSHMLTHYGGRSVMVLRTPN